MSHLAIFAAALALALLASTSAASPTAVGWQGLVFFEWAPAEGQACPREQELTEQVESALHRRVFAPKAIADRVLRASIARGVDRSLTAHFTLTTKDGRSLGDREVVIEEHECLETTEALVLAISLMVDLPPVIGEVKPPAESPPPRPSVHLYGGAGPALAMDTKPLVYPGAQLSFELALPKFWPVSLDLTSWFHSDRTPNQSRYWLAANMVTLGVCPAQLAARRFHLEGCLGPEVTLYVGWGSSFERDRSGVSTTFGGFLKARASYEALPHLQVFASLLGMATPGRVELAFGDSAQGEQAAYRTSAFTAVLVLGASYRFF